MTAAPPNPNLLADYVQTGSKAAFEQIVNQYIHLVHAAAVRQVRDAHLAEDITQAVFLLLWRRAESMQPHGSLAGWLLVTTHHISANAIKKEWRLKQREQKVAQMKPQQDTASTAQANSILPQLDAAMAQLKITDRDAIVERFFNSRSLEEVGATLGVSQQAAAKRINRAMEKLRDILARRGITTSQAILGTLLPTVAQSPGASPSLLSTVLTGHAGAGPTALARNAARPVHAVLKPLAAVTMLLAIGGIVYLAVLSQGKPPTVQSPQVAAPQPAALPTPPPQVPGQRSVVLLLVDPKTNAPLAKGTVELEINFNRGVTKPVGPDGKYVLQLSGNFDYARAICHVPGRVAMSVEFQNSMFKGDLPAQYIIPMEPAATIGGVVLDDIGNPLIGAKVRVANFITGNADAPRVWINENAITDADGKWHVDNIPAKPDNLYLEISHRDYPKTKQIGDAPVDELRRGVYEAVMQVSDGTAISGVVLDPAGNPVKGVRVVIATDRSYNDKPTAVTNEAGKFTMKFQNTEWDNYATATVQGFAPEQVKIPGTQNRPADTKADSQPMEIHLSRPVVLQGVVVDNQGKPVSGAIVESEKWRGNRALDWSTKTDRNGKFVWNDAPADVLQINVSRRDFAVLSGVEVKAGGDPIQLTLYPPLKISGNVLDADSGAPIPAFRIVYGIRWTGQQDVTWQDGASRKLGAGKYDATIGQFSNGGKLRVEADGYLPAESRMINGSEGSIQINFALKKGLGPHGVVLSPQGKPLFDVRVICMPRDLGIFIDPDHDNFANATDIALAKTDKDGRFSIQPKSNKFTLLIMADEGFAMVQDDQFVKDGQIHLQQYGRIEGDYRLNADAAKFVKVGGEVWSVPGRVSGPQFAVHPTVTDANGHFVLDHLPPGYLVNIYQMVPLGGGSERYVQMGNFESVAGQTISAHIGGKGRPVIGKILLPPNPGDVDYDEQVNVNFSLNNDPMYDFMRQLPYPENFPDMTQEDQEKWYQAQMKSHADELKPLQEAESISVQAVVRSDGTFRADNVTPGAYKADVLFRGKLDETVRQVKQLGAATISFTVPTTPPCPTDVPVDIGVIHVEQPTAEATMEIGKPLPNVQLVTLDGKTLDGSAWAGKIVVLHVWEMHDRKFFPVMGQLADKFRDDSRVQIVNVGMNMLPAWARHIDANEHLPGLFVLDKDSSEMNTRQAYNDHAWLFQNPPYVLIIDAHGNVTTKVSDPQKLTAAVEQAMGK